MYHAGMLEIRKDKNEYRFLIRKQQESKNMLLFDKQIR